MVVTTRAIRRAKLQSNRHHKHTVTQTLLQAGCLCCHLTNSVRALQGAVKDDTHVIIAVAVHPAQNAVSCVIRRGVARRRFQ